VTLTIPATGSFTATVPISYTVTDHDDEVTLALYYDRDDRGRDGKLITDCLPEGTGVYNWNVSEVGSGSYYVYARVDDRKNLPVITYTAAITVMDVTTPDAPSNVTARPVTGAIAVSWARSRAADVIDYEVAYGPEPDVYRDVYTATNVTEFRLPVTPSLSTRYIAVRAYDSSRHPGPYSSPTRLWILHLPILQK
jgi:hypothetical protein